MILRSLLIVATPYWVLEIQPIAFGVLFLILISQSMF